MFLPTPIRVSLDVTQLCNLACRHCRQGPSCDGEHALTFDDIVRLIDDVSRMNVFRFVISGGEPFLREDLVEILLRALNSNIGRVFVSTNATCIAWHKLAPLLPFRSTLTFKISLDGNDRLHDSLRARHGAFTTAVDSIARLAADGFDVQINTTITSQNLASLSWLVEWVAASGCSRHHLVEVLPLGRATAHLALTRQQRQAALAAIRRAQPAPKNHVYHMIVKIPFTESWRCGFYCSGGIEECGILSDGSIVACRLMPDLREGNIRHVMLSDVWSDPHAFHPFRSLTADKLSPPCRRCPRAASCLAGCHAYARAQFGDFFTGDPRCPRLSDQAAYSEELTCSVP